MLPLKGGGVGLMACAGMVNGFFGKGEMRHIAHWPRGWPFRELNLVEVACRYQAAMICKSPTQHDDVVFQASISHHCSVKWVNSPRIRLMQKIAVC
jgi:hypothetical protein